MPNEPTRTDFEDEIDDYNGVAIQKHLSELRLTHLNKKKQLQYFFFRKKNTGNENIFVSCFFLFFFNLLYLQFSLNDSINIRMLTCSK